MTQAALQFDAHTLLLGLLGMVCGFLAYWGTRLEQRVDELKARQCLLAEEMHKSYVPREDCRERTAQILGGLERADENRIASRTRSVPGGADMRGKRRNSPELPDASAGTPEERRERARQDFTFFRRAYFPHYCLVGGDSRLHEWLDAELPRMADAPEGVRLAIAAPRGRPRARSFRCFSCCGPC